VTAAALQKPVTVHRNVTQRTVFHAPSVALDCRNCVFMSGRACACPDECDSGDQHTVTKPIQLWRGA
jgi:hypothetical protein